MKTIRVLVAYSLMAAAIALPTNAYAMMLQNQGSDGFNDCLNWCHAHNKTEASLRACENQCVHYWGKHKGVMALSRD